MPGNMYIPPRDRSNPTANMALNFLTQLALANRAHQLRQKEMEEAVSNERAKLLLKRQFDIEDEQRQKPYWETTIGGKPAYIDHTGKITFAPTDKDAKDNRPTSVKEFEFAKENPEYAKFLERQKKSGQPEDQFQVQVDRDGNVSFSKGGQPAGIPLTKPSQTDVEKKIFDIDGSLSRLKEITASYKPEFQTIGTRWSNLLSAGKEKWGIAIPEEDKRALQEFSNYRKSAISNFNIEIKAASGSTVTEQEAGRVLKGLPNPGTGLFDGDSPSEFEAALKQSYKLYAKSKARLMWYRAKGIGDEGVKGLVKSNKVVSLDEMDAIINNRAAQIEKELKLRQPDLPPEALNTTVKRMLQSEFGIE